MSQISIYLDEDSVEKSLIAAFRNASFDVVTVADVGRESYADEDQLIWATQQRRVIYSYKTGIILLRQQRYSIGQQLRGLLNFAADKSASEMVNQLVFLSYYIEKN